MDDQQQQQQPLERFIAGALANGASDQVVLGILRNAGWPEKEALAAAAAHYEKLSGAPVPQRGRSVGGPREAFLHLLSFLTLATWSIAVGSLWFIMVALWLPDPAAPLVYFNVGEAMAFDLAAVLVGFPVFLLVMRTVWRELANQPAQSDSALRRWITYLALLIAAATIIGDLVTLVDYLLRGQITARFVCRVAVVGVLAGGVFWFFLRSVQPVADELRPARLRKDGRIAALAAVLAIAATLVPAFILFGSPAVQRQAAMDDRRSEDLERLAQVIHGRWVSARADSPAQLPNSLDELPERNALHLRDPQSGRLYTYRRLDNSRYQLCATFGRDTRRPVEDRRSLFRVHPAGDYCFAVDALTAGW
jgi:hypothetical protein